jgi:intein/homing endonuclease
MAEMSWAYIAGFFDGEGCLPAWGTGMFSGDVHHRVGRFCIQICQTQEEGRRILLEIADFLASNGIDAGVRSRSMMRQENWALPWNLTINGSGYVVKFIDGVYPYLRVKKQRAEDYRRECILYSKLIGRTNTRWLNPDEFSHLVKSGVALKLIARTYDFSYSAVHERARRMGLPVNTVYEANKKRSKVGIEQLQRDYEELKNYSAVAKKHGLSKGRVHQRLVTHQKLLST